MKVCIFTETFHPIVGGGETQARLLAEGLQSAGCDVTVLTRRASAELPADDWLGAVAVRRIGQSGSGQCRKWSLVPAGLPALVRLRQTCDVVFVSGFRMLGIPAVLFARLFGRPVVLKADSAGEMSGEYFAAGLVRHGLSMRHWPVRLLLALRNALFRRADAFVGISVEAIAELTAAGVDSSRIHRIPNAVDTTRFRPASAERKRALRRALGLPQSAQVIVYTGRLVSYKGLPLLLKVWPRLRAAHPDAMLLLVGPGGLDMHACEAQLRAVVRDERLDDSVRFTGGVENVVDFLQAADVFAFPTENDVFPSSVVEAMACGLPLVTTPVGAINEIIEDGRNGLLISPRDGDALRHALHRLLDDPALAARLAEGALQTVLERYSAAHVTRCYVELFRRVAERA